ncbi:hypothetical protein B0A49_11954, partial [Cryomyces minteri]
RGFGRQSNKGNNNNNNNTNTNQQSKGNGSGPQAPSPTSYQLSPSPLTPSISNTPRSPALPQTMSTNHAASSENVAPEPKPAKVPYFFREQCAGLVVKGNFMTLAQKPIYVELGEWLGHQVVEQYRLLESQLKIIQEKDSTGLPICSPVSCPTMSAAGQTYTWLDKDGKPDRVPASQYIGRLQKWIIGKIEDQNLFPTGTVTVAPMSPTSSSYMTAGGSNTPGTQTPIAAGPTTSNLPLSTLAGSELRDWLGKASGFPEHFETDIKSIYRQMMRCYAHIFHAHWLDPFYNLGAEKTLNTCFIHFVTVGKLYRLLSDKDLEPMQPLVDIWIVQGLLPTEVAVAQSPAAPGPPAPASAGRLKTYDADVPVGTAS